MPRVAVFVINDRVVKPFTAKNIYLPNVDHKHFTTILQIIENTFLESVYKNCHFYNPISFREYL